MTEPTADDPDETLRAVLRRLSVDATRANLERVEVMADALSAAPDSPLPDEQQLAATRAAHQVRGSAGTFGFTRVPPLAAWLEHYFGAVRGRSTSGAAELAEAREKLAALEAELRFGQDGPDGLDGQDAEQAG